VPIEIRRFSATTRTAEDAAREIGTEVARIVKSLVFVADGAPVVALCSGSTRVDEALLAEALGVASVRRATADLAKGATGYAIGGVPPFAHATSLPVYIDPDLLQYDLIYAAAGVPECVFPLTPAELVRATGGQVIDVKEGEPR